MYAFRSPSLVEKVAHMIKKTAAEISSPIQLMHVCGTYLVV